VRQDAVKNDEEFNFKELFHDDENYDDEVQKSHVVFLLILKKKSRVRSP